MTSPSCPRCGAPAAAGARFCRTCGTPLAGGPDSAPPPPARASPPVPAPVPPPQPVLAPVPPPARGPQLAWTAALAPALGWWNRRPRGRTPLLAGAGVALVLVLALAGYLATVAIGNARNPPEQPVRALFAALAAHNTATAAELAGCTTPACTGTALATGYEAPTDVQLGETSYGDPADTTRRPDKSTAYVPVTYRLGDTLQQVTMRLQRTGTGLARPFRIRAGATGRLTVTARHLQQVQLAGARLPVNEQQGRSVTVLPGRYLVQVPDTDPLFAASSPAPARIDVPASADTRATPIKLQVPVRIRPEVTGQVDKQIRMFLDSCTRQDTLDPRGCPFQIPGIVIGADDVHWTLLRTPVIEVVPADEPGPTDPPAAVRTVTPGRVTVTYTAYTSAGGDRDTITQQLPVEISGTVELDPNTGRVIWSS